MSYGPDDFAEDAHLDMYMEDRLGGGLEDGYDPMDYDQDDFQEDEELDLEYDADFQEL